MRLAISNIAWEAEDDAEVAIMLGRYGVGAIDVAPGKYFPDPSCTKTEEVRQVRQWWADRGVEIVGMQALLFGTIGLNVFGTPAVQKAMLDHLGAVFRIAAGLGAKRLVFGSPKNRNRAGLSDDQAIDMATRFFRRVGDAASAWGVILCLEPNPAHYGSNFMITGAETARVVSAIDHPAIRMQYDTGAVIMNGEDPNEVLAQCAHLIGHIHASEPELVPLGDGGNDHQRFWQAFARYLPGHVVTIEMLAARSEPRLAAIERALVFALRSYRPSAGSHCPEHGCAG